MSEEMIEKLKKLVKVSKSLKISQVAKFIGITEEELNEHIVDWAVQFGFELDQDVVIFGAGKKDDFIAALDNAFSDWNAKTESKEGKLDFPPAKPALASNTKGYHGTSLSASELAVMRDLERALGGKAIPSVRDVKDNTFGFSAEQEHVSKLSLYQQGLTSFPAAIGKLKSLQILYIRDNQISALPGTIGQFASLNELSLAYNRLTSLPEMIGQLTALHKLRLSGNILSSLPETIGTLKSLAWLDLNSNKLFSLPETMGQLTSLENLVLANNQLSFLPGTIGQLSSLKKLYLANNRLTSLPETICNLKSLQILDIRFNQISSLPETIKKWIEGLKQKGCNVFQ